jgi:hypothetical protein
VGTARATAELGFQAHQSSAHPTSKSIVANGASSEFQGTYFNFYLKA